jgi:hypothetical protein
MLCRPFGSRYDEGMDDERLAKIGNLMDDLGLIQKNLDVWLDEKAKSGLPFNNEEHESLNRIKTQMRDSIARLSKMIDGNATDS